MTDNVYYWPVNEHLWIDTLRTAAVILGSLATGYGLRKCGWLSEGHSRLINRLTLIYVQPLVIGLALWMLPQLTWCALLLPLYGATLFVAMWPVGHSLGRLLRLERPSLGAFVTSSMFSNVGFTYGTFIAYIALGPPGAALGALYCVSFMPTFFTLGFVAGRFYMSANAESPWRALRRQFAEAETRNPVLGILTGLALRAAHIPAPGIGEPILDLTIPATTAAYVLAIGLSLHLSAVRTYWRECLTMHLAKFVLSPAVSLALATAFGYFGHTDRLPLAVAFVQSAAPVAIMTVMLAEMTGANSRLASALWITTNITSIALAPLLIAGARWLCP